MKHEQEEELLGPGSDLALSLSGILIIILICAFLLILVSSSQNKRMNDKAQALESEITEYKNKFAGLSKNQQELWSATEAHNKHEIELNKKITQIEKMKEIAQSYKDENNNLKIDIIELKRDIVKTEKLIEFEKQRNANLYSILKSEQKQIIQLKKQIREQQIKANDKPPIITISDADIHTFASASAELSSALRQKLKNEIVPQIRSLAKKYDARIIEVIGHTDEVSLGPNSKNHCNMDKLLLSVLNQRQRITSLKACDNTGLGMARAVSVVIELKNLGIGESYILRPLSAGPTTLTNENISSGERVGVNASNPSRRRIEIRIRRINK